MNYENKSKEELIQELKIQSQYNDFLLHKMQKLEKGIDIDSVEEYHLRMKFLMLAANIAWWELDMTNGKVTFDDRKAEMLGYSPAKFSTYIDFTKLLHPDDYDATMLAMKNHLAGLKEIYDVEYRLLASTGDYIWFRDVGSITKSNDDGSPKNLAGVVINISERKNAEEDAQWRNKELQRINAEKDKFFSIIAHDLKSPLNSFLGFTELMLEGHYNMSTENIHNMAKLMNESASGLTRLLDNLLEWSKMKRGLSLVQPISLNLYDEIQEVISYISVAATKKQIRIQFELDDGLKVFMDHNMLKSILRNLVSNAVKFTPRGGIISIYANMDNDDMVVVEVKDTGIGMNQNLLHDLFKLDVNTKRLGTEEEPTTGLGLILCKEFIETNGGLIWVQSEEEKGSSFFFSVPASSGIK